ncbi:MAG: translation initiation factor IF-6 [Candidatus Diapherotrites archaeon]|nr:translation initiation factor IF-6 [Candidatus Diapherotrites archaeon]
MRIDKRTLEASPFLGVFGILTDKIFLVPSGILEKELQGLQDFAGVEVLKASIAASPLLGVLGIGVKEKIAVSDLARDREIVALEKAGLKVTRIEGATALGNLARITEKGGVLSPILSREQCEKLESFFGVKMVESTVAGLDLAGSSIVANSKGFIVHPGVSKEEFARIKNALQVEGIPTTANYGDRFVGNSVLVNSNAMLLGVNTTGHELMRIEEAFLG